MSEFRIVRRGQIEDEFSGFDGDTLFALTDGTYWLQDEYKYWYHYAYRPYVAIVERRGRLYLGLAGSDQRVAIRQVHDIVESRIEGDFTGWSGESKYTLTNGHTYKQTAYKYTYKYAHRPRALVYKTGSGRIMEVAGTTAKVRRA